MTEEHEKYILDNFKNKGIKQCAKDLNIKENSVYYLLRKKHLNGKLRTQDKDFDKYCEIENITKEMAYVFGYLWADGAINGNQIRLGVTKDDGDDIRNILNAHSKWKEYLRNRKNRKPQIEFFITNKKLSDFFKEHGKYAFSIESHEKIFNFLGVELFKYFIRGLIDGDGCYYINKHCVQLSISGRYEQDWNFLVSKMNDLYGIKFSISKREYKNSNGKINRGSTIRSSSINDIINFIKIIYDIDDKIYLKRKHDKILKILLMEEQIKKK